MEQSRASTSNLTQRQLLIWVQERLSPGVAANNMAMTFEIDGALDPDRFRRAFASVVAEFDCLRTVFAEDQDDVPQQRVLDSVDYEVEVVDLSNEKDPRAALHAWLVAHWSKPFVLSERAFECALLRLGPESWIWYLCQNHIITDGTSKSLLYGNVAARYESLEAKLPEAASFQEYRALEREYRASDSARASSDFWSERLAQPLEPIRFYGEEPAERVPVVRRFPLELGTERSDSLREMAERPEVRSVTTDLSVSLLFTTAMIAYLHRISGNSSIGVSMPVLNRRGRQVRNTIGPLLEVIAVRVDVEPDDSFQTLMDKTRDELHQVMRHARHGVPAHGPSFQAMINFQNIAFPAFAGMPVRVESSTGLRTFDDVVSEPSSYFRSGEDISLQIQDFEGTGTYTLDFDLGADIFSEERGRRSVQHFERLFDSMLADPETRIRDVEIVDPAERELCLKGFNPRATPAEQGSLVSTLQERFERFADRPALSFGGKDLSYRELDERATEIATQLVLSGVSPRDNVAVLLERSADLPAALLGVMRAGAAYVPIDPEHPASRNNMILEDAHPTALLTQTSLSHVLDPGEGVPVLCLDRAGRAKERVALPTPDPSDLAYILFTSGSTGRPKGVEISHRNIVNFLHAMVEDEPGIGEDDVLVSVTTVAFDICGLEFYGPWLAGGRVVLADRRTVFDPGRLAGLLERCDATILQATPATWRMLLQDGWRGKADLRAFVGGEALPRELADELLDRCAELWNLYGPTETTVWSTTERVEPSLSSEEMRPVSIGRPIRNMRAYVLDEDRRPVPIGVQGELWLAGVCVGPGYYGRKDLTDSVFVPDIFFPGERMYRTGDLARHRFDGRLEYLGRADQQVKVRGYRIELSEIERAIDLEPTVHECVVVARPDPSHGNRLSAYLTGHKHAAPNIKSVRALLRDKLPAYMIPSDFIVLEAMPLTPNGKISRASLPEPEASRPEVGFDYVAPATAIESVLSSMWSDLLSLEPIGVHDSFFDLGGHSLAAITLFRRMKRELGVDLPISTLFKAPTVRGLAAVVDLELSGEGSGDWSTVVAIQPEGRRIPIFCAAGQGGNIHNLERLAKHLGLDQPFYGLQTRGVVGHHMPHESVEDIARESIGDMKSVQAEGPYVLAGYSAGGSVAFEMARQLTAEGDRIAGLILLDSYSPVIPQRSARERAELHVSRMRKEGPAYVGRKIIDRLEGDKVRVLKQWRRLLAWIFPDRYAHEQFMYRRLVTQRRYRPQPHTGDATLFRVDRPMDKVRTKIAIDEFNGWRQLIEGNLEVIPAPGGHLDMCEEPHVGVLARQMNKILQHINAAQQAGARSRDLAGGKAAAEHDARAAGAGSKDAAHA